MAYVDDGEGPAVLMLHGNPTWSYLYRHMITALAPEHRCVVPDHIGCGFSEKPQNYAYRLRQHIDNTLELIEATGLERFDLVVHDWGGAIGMGVATQMPERVRRLVVTNTAAFRSQSIPWEINLCRTPLLGKLIIRGLNGFAGPATKMSVSREMPEWVKRGFLHPYGNWHDRIATWAFVQDIPMHARHPSWDTLVGIETGLTQLRDHPMLLLWGMRDFCFHGDFLAEWQRRFPAAQTQAFEHAGHYLFEDAEDACAAAMQAFLR